jgi:TP901 family phage tail tape measure protein
MADAVALGGTLYAAIKPAVDFEFAMAQVGAVTEEAANSEGFKKLTEKARELGRTTQYTSAQAAKAMQFLGMAGFNTNQILAATPAILNLAIADNMELGESAEIVSSILNGFAMKAEKSGEAADVLAQAAIATTTNVRMLGETMKFVAPAAAAIFGAGA